MVYSVCQIHTASSWVCANRRRKGRMADLYPVCTLVMAKLVLLQPKILLVRFHPKQECWKSFMYDSNAGVFNIIVYNIKVFFFESTQAIFRQNKLCMEIWSKSFAAHWVLFLSRLAISMVFSLLLWEIPDQKKHCFWTNCVVVWSCLHIDG